MINASMNYLKRIMRFLMNKTPYKMNASLTLIGLNKTSLSPELEIM